MVRRFMLLSRGVFLLLAALVCSTVMRADVTGSVQGTVHDRSQGAIVGAHVLITNVATNSSQESVTAADGTFRILALAAGSYKLTVTATGFRPSVVNDITIQVNDQLHYDVTLEVVLRYLRG